MPTGYTSEIAKGISFEKFVMNCARAFGALITMRDASSDAEIPKAFKPSTHHQERIEQIEKELAKLEKMTIPIANKRAIKEHNDELAYIEKGIRDANGLRQKYLSMLSKVKAWQPPSPDHIGLKDFMSKQISESIDFDCSTKYYTEKADNLCALSPSEWMAKQRTKLLKDLAYNKKEHLEETERVAGRNDWVQKLRKSLNQ